MIKSENFQKYFFFLDLSEEFRRDSKKFEIASVNESSVFELLRSNCSLNIFYFTSTSDILSSNMRKCNFRHEHLTKTQINLRIRAVTYVFVLRMKVVVNASSEKFDQTAQIRRLIRVSVPLCPRAGFSDVAAHSCCTVDPRYLEFQGTL